MWSECRRRGIGIEKLIKWTITNPARQLALDGRKGRLAVGFDGDIVVWAPEATVEVCFRDTSEMASTSLNRFSLDHQGRVEVQKQANAL